MRDNVKAFCKVCSEVFDPIQPIFEIGSLQVPGQEGYADLRPFFKGKTYVGCDIRQGLGVDRIENVEKLTLDDETVGTFIIVDTLEHIENPRRALEEIYRALKRNGMVIMSSVQNFPIHDYPADFWRFTLECFNLLLKNFPSKSKNELVSFFGILGNKISIWHSWLDLKIFRPMDKQRLKEKYHISDNFVVLFVGRLEKYKGVQLLLQVARLLADDPRVLSVFVGPGSLSNKVKLASVKFKNVKYLGSMSAEELVEIYNKRAMKDWIKCIGDDEKDKIILFRPKPHPTAIYKGVPLSLLAIAAPLEKLGYKIKIIDATVDDEYIQKILGTVNNTIICLGITSMTGYQIYDGLKVAKLVKERCPHIPIVWGGFHPSILPKQTVSNPYVDIVVRGQGERTFAQLIYHLKNNLPLNSILGITYKENGKIIENPDRPFEDINNFPPVPYHLVDVEKYVTDHPFVGPRSINYVSSQGCPYRCAFCADQRVYKRRWSGLKAQRVLDDLEHLINKYRIRSVKFNDDNFFVNKERVRQICKGIIERKLNIKWGWANGRADQLVRFDRDRDLWRLIKKSRCTSILIGAESGSQKILDLLNKDITVEDTIKLARICRSYGIKIVYSLMIGLPTQNIEKEFNKTVNLINRIQSICDDHKIMWFIYTPYPGTPLYDLCVKSGLEEPKSLEEWSQFDLQWNSPWVPRRYRKLIEQFNIFIFPFISRRCLELSKKVKRLIVSRLLHYSLIKLFHYMALFRLRYKFFSLPVEHVLIKTKLASRPPGSR